MVPTRTILIGSLLLLAGCASLTPPAQVAPDPAVAERVSQLSDGGACSAAIAGTLTARHITAGQIASIREGTPGGRHEHYEQNQAWVTLTGRGGHIVVQYTPLTCWIDTVYASDGATLPTAG
ncbi:MULTISPECIES: hypothetical protein [Inquilinus]|uniref:Lipoprotein n=1 Tax=Inquilinus ginsengisoli TaxID=363840 RepID=A0ABU1JGU6_9PROT|nr:hypothetical protein [Inquilinus ginsengisoli]MDR6287547.1 hypothetical protein [Inquilinus ginsengisoli]